MNLSRLTNLFGWLWLACAVAELITNYASRSARADESPVDGADASLEDLGDDKPNLEVVA